MLTLHCYISRENQNFTENQYEKISCRIVYLRRIVVCKLH